MQNFLRKIAGNKKAPEVYNFKALNFSYFFGAQNRT